MVNKRDEFQQYIHPAGNGTHQGVNLREAEKYMGWWTEINRRFQYLRLKLITL